METIIYSLVIGLLLGAVIYMLNAVLAYFISK